MSFLKTVKGFQPHCSGFFSASANLVAMALLLVAPFVNILGLVFIIIAVLLEKNSGLVKQSACFAFVLWLIESIFLFVVYLLEGSLGVLIGLHQSTFLFSLGMMSFFQLLNFFLSALVLAAAIWSAVQAYQWKIWNWNWLVQLSSLSFIPPAKYSGEGDIPEECTLKYKK